MNEAGLRQVGPDEAAGGIEATGARVASLYRYPVKGLSPQAETSLDLVAGEGLVGDRRFALALGDTSFDPAAPEPLDKGFFLMLRRDERLAALTTRYDAANGVLSIAEPGGATMRADLADPDARAAVEAFFQTYIGAACQGRPKLVEAEGHKFTDISVVSPAMMRAVSVINLASVRDLAARIGRPLDPLRFRGNIQVDGIAAGDELGWVGREVAIGGATMRGLLRTKRCAAIDVDPATGARDTNLTKAIVKAYGHPDCGVYLEVVGSGTITVGDAVRVG